LFVFIFLKSNNVNIKQPVTLQIWLTYRYDFVQSELNGLNGILSDSRGRAYFMKHLVDEYAVENLRFYEEVQDFKHTYSTLSDAQQTLWAKQIYTTFIPNSSILQINIPNRIRANLDSVLANAGKQKLPLNMFDECETEVVHIMRGSFLRFLNSKLYAEFMGVVVRHE